MRLRTSSSRASSYALLPPAPPSKRFARAHASIFCRVPSSTRPEERPSRAQAESALPLLPPSPRFACQDDKDNAFSPVATFVVHSSRCPRLAIFSQCRLPSGCELQGSVALARLASPSALRRCAVTSLTVRRVRLHFASRAAQRDHSSFTREPPALQRLRSRGCPTFPDLLPNDPTALP